jgi:hypothetical protein
MKNNYERYSTERLKILYKKRVIRRDELVKLGELMNKFSIQKSIITTNMILEKIGEEELERIRLHNYISIGKDIIESDKKHHKEWAIRRYKYKLKW